MVESSEQSDSAFLDVATNTLAALLIVTMLSLVTTQRQKHLSTTPEAQSHTSLAFMEPQRPLVPPWNSYFFVVEDRVVRWDLEAVVRALLSAPEVSTGGTRQGTYRLLGEPLTPHDIDTFDLDFACDRHALLADHPPLSASAEEAFLATLRRDYAALNTVPTFVVYASGMERFATLYPHLEQAGLRFRWVALHEGEPLRLSRQPWMFTSYSFRR